MITPAQHRWARRQPLGLRPGKLYEQIREPYFFGYVRDQLVKAYGARDRPLGRAQGLHDDRAALAAARAEGDQRHA